MRDDIYKLYKGVLEENDTQYMTPDSKSVRLQALLVKVLDVHPDKGERKEWIDMLEAIDRSG